FIRPCTGQIGQARSQVPVVRNPGACGLLVTQHAEVRPVIELLLDELACRQWHEAQRVTAQVEQLTALRVRRERKSIPEIPQRVRFIARPRMFECRFHVSSKRYRRGRLGTASPPMAGAWISRRYAPSLTSPGTNASSVRVARGRVAAA